MSAITLFKKANPSSELAVFGGGCFWGMEKYFRQQFPNVVQTKVGYTGGQTPFPSYQQVCSGSTGHAEALIVEYAKGSVDYGEMCKFFFSMHDPTTPNK